MAFATRTVRRAEAFQRDGKSGQRRVQRAFVAAGNRPGAGRFSGAGQLIDMPMRKLFSPHVAGDPRRQPARPLGRAAVNVMTGRQNRGVSARPDGQRRVELDQQRIGAFSRGAVAASTNAIVTLVHPVARRASTARGRRLLSRNDTHESCANAHFRASDAQGLARSRGGLPRRAIFGEGARPDRRTRRATPLRRSLRLPPGVTAIRSLELPPGARLIGAPAVRR